MSSGGKYFPLLSCLVENIFFIGLFQVFTGKYLFSRFPKQWKILANNLALMENIFQIRSRKHF